MDLFVRVSNQVAVNMYKRLGYSVYRTVIEYYSASNGEPDEDAYGESVKTQTFFSLKKTGSESFLQPRLSVLHLV